MRFANNPGRFIRLVIGHRKLRLGQAHDDLVVYHFDAERSGSEFIVVNFFSWVLSGIVFGLDSRDKVRCKVRGQALNDVNELQDFLLAQGVNLVVQQFDFEFRLDVYSVVVFCVLTINLRLTVLAHHDDRRRIGGLEGKDQVQQDEGIRVPMVDKCEPVQNNPNAKYNALDDDESPGTDCFGKPVGDDRASRWRELRRVTGRLLRPKFPQALMVFGAQLHFVTVLVSHHLLLPSHCQPPE
jgi:hypothetical protein